jgi:hypothetical protein
MTEARRLAEAIDPLRRKSAPDHLTVGCAAQLLEAQDAEIERLRRALHDIAEEWAGAECGEPVHAQEAYAIGLANRMYRLAADALKEPR